MTGVESIEGVDNSTPSLADITALSVENVEPDMKDAIEKAVQVSGPITVADESHSRIIASATSGVLSQEYMNMYANAFGNNTIPTTNNDIEPLSVENVEETEYTEEEKEALESYVSVDEVDISQYDADHEFEIPEADISSEDLDRYSFDVSNPTDDTIMVTETINPSPVVTIDKDALLSSILTTNEGTVYEQNPIPISTPIEETTESVNVDTCENESIQNNETDASELKQVEYNLTTEQLRDVIYTINRYEEKYFKGVMPAHDFSKKFLMNIPVSVYKAHYNAVNKYEYPDILDPLFYLYILIVKLPGDGIGKYVDTIATMIENDQNLRDEIKRVSNEYEEYIKDFPEEISETEE